jgi:iron complex outermembrane receptor protein
MAGIMALLLFSPLFLLAQENITGTVNDNAGKGIPGVTVTNKSSTASAVTALNGSYSIRAKKGDVLVFSAVSYAEKELTVGTGTAYNLVMETTAGALGEVVVVGYGKSTRKALTSAITTLKPEDLNRGAITDVGRWLQGKVPGLNISANGDPNRRAAIVLRGASTINSPSGPFYVIDGVPGGDISLIAPDDIASVDVLKDAAATAIYGNRASSAVIMITTKKGRKGQSQVNYSGFAGFEQVSSRLNVMDADQHRAYLRSQNRAYSPADDNGANTDWQEALMRDQAFTHNHNISFSGGGEHNLYAASVNYVNKEGIMKRSAQERLILRLSLEQLALNHKLKFSLNVTNSRTKTDLVPFQNSVFDQVSMRLPVSTIYNADGTWTENFNTPGYFNPVGMIDNALDDNTANNLIASFNTEVKLPFNLTHNSLLSHQNLTTTSQQFYSSYYNRYSSSQFFTDPDPGLGVGASLVGNLFGLNGAAYRNS